MIKYNQSFWLFTAIIAVITGGIILINIYSPVSGKELTRETGTHIKPVEDILNSIQKSFDQYGCIIDQFVENSSNSYLPYEEIEVIERELLLDYDYITSIFYQIAINNSEQQIVKHIDRISQKEVSLSQIVDLSQIGDLKSAKWVRVLYNDTGDECFLYIRPISQQNKSIGYIGMLLSCARILEQIEKKHESFNWDYFIFTDESETEKFIGKTEWVNKQGYFKNSDEFLESSIGDGGKIYSYKILDTGMIYVEVHKGLKQIHNSNGMILLISIFSITAMWMIQRKNRNGKTIFDQASDYIMKKYIDKINSIQKQGYRATIALNIGMTTAIFADVVYSIILGREINVLLEYLLFFLMSLSVLLFYKLSRTGITKKMAKIIITTGLVGPFAEHIISGGFSMSKAGESFLWYIVCIFIALFILGADKSVNVLSAFVVLLFLDVVLEVILFQRADYVGSYLFSIGFILLGFALYNAMEVYVSGAASHYNQTNELIKELNKNQVLLLRKEKLGALGQLISGVAHEINTPIGAIKASVETMDSMFIITLEEILSAAEVYSDEEYEAFIKLVSMTLESKREMKSTLEIRIEKKEVKQYFEEINLQNREHIVTLLGELEIVNLDQIKTNLTIFKMDHIINILENVTKLTPFASGIPIILYASDRVAQIVLALKSYVHTSSDSENIEFDLIKNIENVLILFRNQLKGNIKITRNYGISPCIITGNPDELAQVWTNLIQNAVHAMNDGGELTIGINEMDNKTITVSFGDTGTGIAPGLLGKIYDPFFTTDQSGEGTGLGLSISKKIIEKYHGVLDVESGVGKGTIFHIHLNKIREL